MEFHPQKCQLLRITNKLKPFLSNYSIHNTTILETDAAKYLGVIIDSKLNWKKQFISIRNKCNRTLSFIMRNLNKCPQSVKARCYTALVRPIAEYACQVWDPHFKIDITNLEKIQNRAGRFATGNYLLETGNSKINRDLLGWETLEERRQQIKLTTFQRARLKLLEIPTDHLDIKNRQTYR